MSMKSWLLLFTGFLLLLLHQDVWFWDSARPLVFGFLPIGLFYHAIYTITVSAFMLVLTRFAWPTELNRRTDRSQGDEN